MTRTARIPAMANAHSHAFQLDLRGVGRTAASPGDDFWSWRTEMYRLASSHTPESMHEVGAAASTGRWRPRATAPSASFTTSTTSPTGRRTTSPTRWRSRWPRRPAACGLEITLLPAAYHRGGGRGPMHRPPPGRCASATRRWRRSWTRVDALRAWADGVDGVSVGVAAHSVRAVPAAWLEEIARYTDEHGLVRHVHASEQRRELAECQAEHGCSPIELLDRTGFLGPRTSVVHAIHVSERDIALLAESDSIVVTCPTTEGNLGDGHLPGLRYRDAGVRLAIGTDEQTRIDPFEELREMETLARREGHTRFALLAAADGDLWGQMVANGRASLGLPAAPVAEIELNLEHPDLANVADGGPHAGAGHLRLGGGGARRACRRDRHPRAPRRHLA